MKELFKKILVLILIVLILYLSGTILKSVLTKSYLINKAGFSQAIYSKDEKLLSLTLSTDEKYRLFLPLKDISAKFIKSIVTQEDRFFYYHIGVNPFAVIRGAFLTYFLNQKTGGSTITMQLARIRFRINSKNIFGKIQQILSAIFLEIIYNKNEILEAYLNSIPFGANIEGIGAASLIYLNKEAKHLNLSEAILLAVIPESPAARNPAKQSEKLYKAADVLLSRLENNEKISSTEIRKIKLSGQRQELPKIANHLVSRLTNQNQFQSKIVSTIDLKFQLALEQQVKAFVNKNKGIGINNAVALLVDCSTLKVRSYIGSADFWNKSIFGQVDGITARRSPGSVLKPFIYGLGIDEGLIHPGTIMKDLDFSRAAYNPENFEKDFVGLISATDALVRSRNLPAVILLNQLSPDYYLNFLNKAGIKDLKKSDFYGLSLALGGVEVRPDEVASLYCMLNNSGELDSLKLIENDFEYKHKKMLSEQSAFLVREMLKANEPPQSVANSNAINKMKIPWKTGTSFGFKDAWSAGLIGNYALVVWVGNFDGKENPVFIGRDTAGVLFFKMVETILSLKNIKEDNKIPFGVKKVQVCSKSGELPGKYCNSLKSSWYIPGKSSIKTCQVHRGIRINPQNGLATCRKSTIEGRLEIFEIWESDLAAIFNKVGIKLRQPPAYEPECFGYNSGHTPNISSPQENIIYKLQKDRLEIPFTAVTDADVKEVTWFIDDQILTTVKNTETYFWKAKPGDFLVRVVDEQGRSNSINIKVQGQEIR